MVRTATAVVCAVRARLSTSSLNIKGSKRLLNTSSFFCLSNSALFLLLNLDARYSVYLQQHRQMSAHVLHAALTCFEYVCCLELCDSNTEGLDAPRSRDRGDAHGGPSHSSTPGTTRE